MKTFLRKSLVLVLPLFMIACGESGSEPDQFSEVQYLVSQDGGGTFALRSLSAGGFQRRISADAVYSTLGPVHFAIEGAPSPYAAQFCKRSGGDMSVSFIADSSNLPGQVRLLFGTSGHQGSCRALDAACTGGVILNNCLADSDCSGGQVCEKQLDVNYPSSASPALAFADPDVRFEVCVPTSGSSCSVSGDPPATVFGRVVSGSVGDIASTYLVVDETPSVYFLNSAKDNVSGIFRAAADEFLQARLFVNNVVRDTQAGTKDVIIGKDL